MNTKLTFFTLAISCVVSFTSISVHADAFRITRDRYEESQQKEEKNEHKDRKQQPDKDQSRQEHPRNDQQKFRPADKQPPAQSDRDERDRRDTYRDRDTRPPARVDRDRYQRPPAGLFESVKRKVEPVDTVKRPRHHIYYRDNIRPTYHYVEGPWYYTLYISPFPYYYYPIGFEIEILPSTYVRFYIGGLVYYYYSGIYYRPYRSGYIVVAAPIGAFVTSLPEGFIAFTIGLVTYYYLNNTYYIWDDDREGYLVVEKPAGADDAIARATSKRLVVYPNKGQNEEQQAKDRYECHRWAVTESGFDPTMEDQVYSANDSDFYRRALAACLEARDYTVK